jgi:hypothetical protein
MLLLKFWNFYKDNEFYTKTKGTPLEVELDQLCFNISLQDFGLLITVHNLV